VKNYSGEKTIDVFGKATNYNSTTIGKHGKRRVYFIFAQANLTPNLPY
jgi:hypothetical protein